MANLLLDHLNNLGWQPLAIIATVIYGLMNFLYKVAAEQKCSGFYIMSFSGLSVSIISGLIVFANGSAFAPLKWLLIFAGINALFFATGSICKIEALKHIPASLTFPVVKFNSVLTIIIAIIFFHERPNSYQIAGILTGFSVIGVLTLEKWKLDNVKNIKLGFIFSLAAACSTSISMTVGKLASKSVPKINYIFISYTLVAFYSYIASSQKRANPNNEKLKFKDAFFGCLIGSLNLFGYFLVLKAFSIGPMSGVQPIFAMSIVMPILLSRIFYKEELNLYRVGALILSLLSIILIAQK